MLQCLASILECTMKTVPTWTTKQKISSVFGRDNFKTHDYWRVKHMITDEDI